MSNARTIPWETIADWYAKNEQAIRDVMKFEGLRGAVNEVLRLAPDQPELAALREELAKANRGLANCKLALDAQTHNYGVTNLRLTATEQRNADDLRDANRYRWIRSQTVGHCEIQRTLFETISDDCNPPYRSLKYGKDLDDAIDAQAKPTESGASE